MPKSNELAVKTPTLKILYPQLLNNITLELRSGLLKAQKMLEYARLQTHWKIGRLIVSYAELPHEQYPLTRDFYEKLSNDLWEQESLDISVDSLKRSAQFFRNYLVFPEQTPLTWTHYLFLMRVRDVKKRLQIENRAISREWTSSDLLLEIKRFKLESPALRQIGSAGQLVFQRGKPYTYRICEVEDACKNKILSIDIGFGSCRDIPEGTAQKLYSGDIVCTRKTGRNEYSLTTNNKRRGLHYTYPAHLLKIVDGDTLDLRIDTGFSHRLICERVRLRGINAPEMKEPGGLEAKEFLFKFLSKCPVFVVRTIKASGKEAEEAKDSKEMFGRWLVDVFAIPKCEDPIRIAKEGIYLNQMMIDEGMARHYNC